MFFKGCDFKNEGVHNKWNNQKVQNKPKNIWLLDIISLVLIVKGRIPDFKRVANGRVWKVKRVHQDLHRTTNEHETIVTFWNKQYH